MRNIGRISPFMQEVAQIWQDTFPDWRFGQFITNFENWVRRTKRIDLFYVEESEYLEYLNEYADESLPNRPRR